MHTLLVLWLVFTAGSVQAQAAEEIAAEARGLLSVTLDRARAVLMDVPAFGDWFPSLDAWTVLARSNAGFRVHGRHALPWPIRDRDYVVDYRWRDGADGSFELVAQARADGPPPKPRVIRLDVLESRWHLKPVEGGTRVAYTVRFLPRGNLPRWLEGRSWQQESWRLIDALEREIDRRAREAAL
ncbi:MAG: START domain-containing protein [Pseudomonadota bacterium]